MISALKKSIAFIQLKLSDFVSGLHASVDRTIADRLTRKDKLRLTSPSAVLMLDGRRFELVNPVCPECGSSKVVKQEFRKRNPKLADFGELEIYVRRYKCHHCGRKFTTRIEGVVKPNDQYARLVKEYVNAAIAKGYSSLSELQFQVFVNFGLLPSRQAVWNWIGNEVEVELEPSGYYCYDEEYLKIDGEKRYRLTLFDHITNIVVDETITKTLQAKEIEGFLRTVLEGKPLVAITTDGRRDYKGIIEGLGAIHQLCVFHEVENLLEDLYYYLRDERIEPMERMAAARLATEFQNVFRSESYGEAEEKFERLLDSYRRMPSCLKKYVDKVMVDFDRYTAFLRDPMISKTSNPVEEYFRQTSPEKVKRIYKSPHGLMKYLKKRAAFWSIKHGLLSPEISRFIGLKLLGRRFADRNIEMLFSNRKKHFLSYWTSQPPMI
jgi:transposase-like protein